MDGRAPHFIERIVPRRGDDRRRGRGRGTEQSPGAARAPAIHGPGAASCACGGTCPRCQRHPSIQGRGLVADTGDPREREADRVAGQVTHMADPPLASRTLTVRPQARPAGEGRGDGADLPALVSRVVTSAGEPLDAATRRFFEPRFAQDFGRVRVHISAAAAASARAVNALAYTVGRHVVFDHGQYRPHTATGKELLAHELTHVLQQGGLSGAPATTLQRMPGSSAPQTIQTHFQRWLGGNAVQIQFRTENPQGAEGFQFWDLQRVFIDPGAFKVVADARPGTWIRCDLDAASLAVLAQGAVALIDPTHWVFWIRSGSQGYEAQAEPTTRTIVRTINIAAKQASPTEASLLQAIGKSLSEDVSCRARYFYTVTANNGLSPATLADYGNWCGKGGRGSVLDTLDQCCKEHDLCYGGSQCSIFDDVCRPECDRCDDQAVQCWLRAIAADGARYGTLDNIRYPCADCNASTLTPEKKQRCDREC